MRVVITAGPDSSARVSPEHCSIAAQLGPKLGMRPDPDFDSIVRAYIADERPAAGR